MESLIKSNIIYYIKDYDLNKIFSITRYPVVPLLGRLCGVMNIGIICILHVLSVFVAPCGCPGGGMAGLQCSPAACGTFT